MEISATTFEHKVYSTRRQFDNIRCAICVLIEFQRITDGNIDSRRDPCSDALLGHDKSDHQEPNTPQGRIWSLAAAWQTHTASIYATLSAGVRTTSPTTKSPIRPKVEFAAWQWPGRPTRLKYTLH